MSMPENTVHTPNRHAHDQAITERATTQTTIVFAWDLSPVAGEYADDFDMEAVNTEYVAAIEANVRAVCPSASLHPQDSGFVVYYDPADHDALMSVDWDGDRDQRPGSDFDVTAALQRHEWPH